MHTEPCQARNKTPSLTAETVKNPQLDRLKAYQEDISKVQTKIQNTVKRGLKSANHVQQLAAARHARQLLLQLIGLTWESIALQMLLAGELLPTWLSPIYYRNDELGQWAKIRRLSTGGYIFESIDRAGQAVLAELATLELPAPWHECNVAEYRALLQHVLETRGLQWGSQPVLQWPAPATH